MRMMSRLADGFAGAIAIACIGVMVFAESRESGVAACTGGGGVCGLRAWSNGLANAVDAGLAGRPRLLAFSSAHCPACERMKPVLAEVESACSAATEIARLDVDTPDGERVGAAYEVEAVPMFLTVDASGREIVRLVGVQSKERLEQAIEGLAGTRCAFDDR